MKRLIFIALSVCVLAASCARAGNPVAVPEATASPAPTEALLETQSPVETEAPPTQAPTPVPSPVPYVPDYTYGSHTNPDEANYNTMLADLSTIAAGELAYATQEPPGNWGDNRVFVGNVQEIDPVWGIDVRATDVSNVDLSGVEDFGLISFDSKTVFGKVPDGFNPAEILESNKDAGLGIHDLHMRGIMGTGVGIAIIDQALLLDHEEYKHNLMSYERIHCADTNAQMHGPAVASIAVGTKVGVAPGADLYYIATTFGHFTETGFEFDASVIADCIYRVLEINKALPDDKKIRVISISRGYDSESPGADILNEAINQADKQNIFVITTTTEEFYDGFMLFGIGRSYTDDQNDANSFRPAAWIKDEFYANPDNQWYKSVINFPMGSRAYASCLGPKDYEITRDGGLSWAVPWAAGLYALCCQVYPETTPEDFIRLLYETADTGRFEHNGQAYELGNIVNPARVVDEMRILARQSRSE
jgi:hypothetical protein